MNSGLSRLRARSLFNVAMPSSRLGKPADQAAATYLHNAGISGKGLVDFFDNFRYQEVFDESRRFAYFRSHPISSERISALRARIKKQINLALGSAYVEEKSYQDYKAG
mgnify:CR=1 FL=1